MDAPLGIESGPLRRAGLQPREQVFDLVRRGRRFLAAPSARRGGGQAHVRRDVRKHRDRLAVDGTLLLHLRNPESRSAGYSTRIDFLCNSQAWSICLASARTGFALL